jgi:3-oxoadipate enol-lactonase
VTTVEDARFLYERIPGARLSVLPASHISNIEAAAAFNQALSSFLQ